jgi:lipopolysaccharide transport system ATP-binding protein
MSNTAIKIQDLGKLYRLGEVGTGTLSHDLNRWWHRVRGKEDPYQKIGQSNDRTIKAESDYVWALRDINLEVKKGEVLGIIGRNGAGKSTLLKILSQVTSPTTGRVEVFGRIASLLEVGTGFHPELTGRENIFLNGAILGMRRHEIQKKFDEIVDFAGVEAYIDTPVKRYSSGMYVRLAFAVAAFLEPEILVVDEVLAVGDAEFQKKCLGRMKDVSVNEGRTVLFVSHNMGAIRSLCHSVALLKDGGLEEVGAPDLIVSNYEWKFRESALTGVVAIQENHRKLKVSKEIEICEVELFSSAPDDVATFRPIELRLRLKANSKQERFRVMGSIFSSDGRKLLTFFSNYLAAITEGEEVSVDVSIDNHNLAKGEFYFALSIGLGQYGENNLEFDIVYEVLPFSVSKTGDKELPLIKWPANWGDFALNVRASTNRL